MRMPAWSPSTGTFRPVPTTAEIPYRPRQRKGDTTRALPRAARPPGVARAWLPNSNGTRLEGVGSVRPAGASLCCSAPSNRGDDDMDANRRAFLGTAALGACGLVRLAHAAAEERPTSNPGDGGFGRNAVQLPPGDKVAYHDPKDVGAMPDFRFSLAGHRPKNTPGAGAEEAPVHQLPISKTIAGVHMFLDPGASRELHWHAIAAEWAYVIDGRCQTVVLAPSGASEINNYVPGDLWYFPKGHGHSIQTIGDKPCHFILSFDNGAFSEHGTFSIPDWVDVTPKDMLAQNFGLPKDVFDAFPKGETYIQAGPVLPTSEALDAPWPRESTHKFSLLRDPRAARDFEGGTFREATVDEWPISKTMSGGVMTIKPGATRNLHWNPNANEWHYY